jgi:hypothetical protein
MLVEALVAIAVGHIPRQVTTSAERMLVGAFVAVRSQLERASAAGLVELAP